MSEKYPGGFITKNPTAPTSSAAPGIWTLDQALQYTKAGTWPTLPSYIEDAFGTYVYTGTGSTQSIDNGLNLSTLGGLVWFKWRSGDLGTSNHAFFDTVRGTSVALSSNLSNANLGWNNTVSSFNSNGFTLGTDTATVANIAANKYVSWSFIKKQKFFDITTFTGTGSNQQYNHSLGSVPGCILVKNITSSQSWYVYHRSLTTPTNNYLILNSTTTEQSISGLWGTVDSTQFGFAGNSGHNYIAYVFAHNAGGFGLTGSSNVISCGSYTGNGGAIGPEINLGYEAQWVLIKGANVAGSHWYLMDNIRGMGYRSAFELYPNLNVADQAQSKNVVPTATGFQILTTDGYLNNSGSTYIYVAIRRGPMKSPTSSTSVFNVTNTTAANTIINTGFDVDFVLSRSQQSTFTSFTNIMTTRTEGTGAYLLSNATDTEQVQGSSLPNWYYSRSYNIGGGSIYDTDTYTNYAIKRAPGFFDVVFYTGNNPSGGTTTQTITHNLGVAPELIIVKNRLVVGDWYVYAATLGANKNLRLNTTVTAGTSTTFWNNTNPTSTVFSVGATSGTNANAESYLAYLFATITGISKVGSYTGTGTTQQINCGFTSGSRFVLIKRTDATGNWYLWDATRGIVAGNDPYFILNTVAAQVTSFNYVNTYSLGFAITSTAPAEINANGGTYIFLAIA